MAMASRDRVIFGVTLAFALCATLFVCLRTISRAGVVRKLALDDYIMLFAWLIFVGLVTAICLATSSGLGMHEVDIPDAWQQRLKRSQFAFSILYQLSLMAEKTSILTFYLTLSTTNRVFRWATIATLVAVNVAGFALIMGTVFECDPVSGVVDYPTRAGTRCTDLVVIYLASAPVNIITDLAIFFLPMPVLTRMRLPKRQKLILVITFGFGIFVIAVDIIRVAYLQKASTFRLTNIVDNNSDSRNSRTTEADRAASDFSFSASYSFMWSVIEVALGIMCGSVPALKPLFTRFLPHLIHERRLQSLQSKLGNPPSGAPPPSLVVMPLVSEAPAQDQPPESDTGPLDLRHFLAGAEEARPAVLRTNTNRTSRISRAKTDITMNSGRATLGSPVFQDFISTPVRKSIVRLTNRESIFPVAMVTVLFFIWGFEYGLLATLNAQFQEVAKTTPGQVVGLRSAYYAGYLIGPLAFGSFTLKYWGFKACYCIGLGIYACGSLIFWPAAVLTLYPVYVVVNFIVGAGLSILETAANPFIALCGPPEYAEVRLNLSQGLQAIGTIVAPLIAAKGFVKQRNGTTDTPSLVNTQWAYLAIALATVCLAVAYFYVPLPEATDSDFEEAAEERLGPARRKKIAGIPIIWALVAFGTFSQFCYVGGQEVVATAFPSILDRVSSYNATDFMAIAHAMFAISRFIAAGAGIFVPPRVILLICQTGCIVFSALAMNFSGGKTTAMLLMVFFFEGPIFSLLFVQAIRGQGKHVKLAAPIITAAISGGAVFVPISHAVANSRGAQYSMCVALAAFAVGTLFPVWLNIDRAAQEIVDPKADVPSHAPADTKGSAGLGLTTDNEKKIDSGVARST